MNTRFILYTATGALLWQTLARAGNSAGGTGASAVLIPADTLSAGGGQSAGGSGANAVLVTSSMGGIVSTVTATSPAVTNKQGYIPQIQSGPAALTGFDLWASNNIPAGRDATFTGDGNGDGISNGVAYVFGNTPISMTGQGRIPVPPSIPPDTDVYLDKSPDLGIWNLARVSWVNGAAPTFVNGNFSIVNGVVVDVQIPAGGKAFYRYRVVKR